MKVYVGLSFEDGDTGVSGVSDDRERARELVEKARKEPLHWAADSHGGLDDRRGDLVGYVKEYEVGGSAKLSWEISEGSLTAKSILHDDDENLVYTIAGSGGWWTADLDGRDFANGTLEHCMSECRKAEDAIIQAEEAKTGEKHGNGRLLWMLKRFLDPEDLGRSVPGYIRDEVRVVLGMRRVETKS